MSRRRFVFVLAAIFFLLTVGISVHAQNKSQKLTLPSNFTKLEPKIVPGQLIVKFRETPIIQKVFLTDTEVLAGVEPVWKVTNASSVDALNILYKSTDVSVLASEGSLQSAVIVNFPSNIDLEAARNAYNADPAIEYAEYNSIWRSLYVPNDEYYSGGGGTPLEYYQWNLDRINMSEAWDFLPNSSVRGDPGIVVAVVDSGVAFESYFEDDISYSRAPELAHVPFVAPQRFKSVSFDSACNPTFSVPVIDAHPFPSGGHGTHVTSIIVQLTNNSSHAAGIVDNVSIMPVKVLHGDCGGLMSDIALGITHARQNGADVINLSLGGIDGSLVGDAIKDATEAGIVVIAATGNDAERYSSPAVSFPANMVETIAVGATRYDNKRSFYSQYGPEVDLVAPGGQMYSDDVTAYLDQNADLLPDGILAQSVNEFVPSTFTSVGGVDPFWGLRCAGSTGVDNDCGLFMGTSMAASHVSAVAAFLLSQDPTLTPERIRQVLIQSAQKSVISGYNGSEYGAGLLDASAALMLLAGGETVGDVDGDQDIDYLDYGLLQLNYGSVSVDITNDGIVGIEDLNLIIRGI